jgi:hypothetical protein
LDAEGAAVEDVGVDHGGGDVAVAEELLDGADVVASLEEVGGKGVAEGVAANALGELGGDGGLANGALEDGFVEVVATAFVGGWVEVDACGGEEPLPGPFARRAGVFDAEGVWDFDVAGAAAEVGLVLVADALEVGSQWADQGEWERREAVFLALAVAHADFSSFEVEVFDAESGAFEQA